MKIRKAALFAILTLLILGIPFSLINILPERVWDSIQAVGAIVGIVLVLVELRSNRDLSQGSFITNLTDSFNNNDSIQHIYKKLELNEPITDDDTVEVVSYLTYFETIYVLLKKSAIDISLIDDLFAYRFRLALKNHDIGRISLIRHDKAYVNLYKLDQIWSEHSHSNSILKAKNPINYPILTRGGNIKADEVMLRVASVKDAQEVHSIMQQVYDGLEDKSIYVCDDLDYVRTHIEKNGLGVVACNHNNEIVASFILRFPHDSDDNLGRDIGLSDDELTRVVHMETAVVLPQYRGRNLQQMMLSYAEHLIDTNKYDILLATVSPDNPASYKSFERSDYDLVLTKEKYGGLQRRIYMKRIYR